MIEILTQKKRLMNVMEGISVDRSPVICPGGMMNSAIVEVVNESGVSLPEAHLDAKLMVSLAEAVYEKTGFENFGIPFCMTVEAEVLGSAIDLGSLKCEPKIAKEVFPDVKSVQYKDIAPLFEKGRIKAVSGASKLLADKYPDVPVIGSITGPISLAASIVDPMTLLKDFYKNSQDMHNVLSYVTDFLAAYAEILAESGVSVISIADPTATGEILGPMIFKKFAVQYLKKLVSLIHASGLPVIVHICGKITAVENYLPEIEADTISLDALINLKKLKEEFPSIKTMGNVSTFLLEYGLPDKIKLITEKLVKDGIDIIAPACGLSTSTKLENIRAMTQTVWKK